MSWNEFEILNARQIILGAAQDMLARSSPPSKARNLDSPVRRTPLPQSRGAVFQFLTPRLTRAAI